MQTVTTFLIGLRHRQIRLALAPHGLTREEIERGWRFMIDLADDGRFDDPPSTTPLIIELDAWENLWFPITDAALAARFPEVQAQVFRNLRQSTGIEVVMGVRTFLERIDGIEGSDARRLLIERGLTAERLEQARALLQRIERAEHSASTSSTDDGAAASEEAMWRWYKEWSAVARAVITDRRQLIALGFQRV
jgi:hypothetical protein